MGSGGKGEKQLSQDQMEVIGRLRRIEGQVRGLQRMVEEERPCESVITQLMAARAALDQVGVHMITHHVQECARAATPDEPDKQRLERALNLFLKLQ